MKDLARFFAALEALTGLLNKKVTEVGRVAVDQLGPANFAFVHGLFHLLDVAIVALVLLNAKLTLVDHDSPFIAGKEGFKVALQETYRGGIVSGLSFPSMRRMNGN